MSKSSGFREIVFKDQVCKYKDIGFSETEYCDNGIIYMINSFEDIPFIRVPLRYNTNKICKACNGTGTIDSVEVKVE